MISEVLDKLSGVKRAASGWTAKCPGHDDRHASLSVSVGDDDQVLIHCHAGCTFDHIVEASGLPKSAFFADKPPRREVSANRVGDLSLAAYCEAKGFDAEWLVSRFGVREVAGVGLEMPYYEPDGESVAAVRRRHRLDKEPGGDGRFSWPAGTRAGEVTYGTWLLAELPGRERHELVVVEGESDVQAGWFHGLPTIGLPGMGTGHDAAASFIVRQKGLRDVCLVVEPGADGRIDTRFADALRRAGYRGRLWAVRLPVKDLCELHKAYPEHKDFAAQWKSAKSAGRLVLGQPSRGVAGGEVFGAWRIRMESGEPVAVVRTGEWLDNDLRLLRGTVTTVGGSPGIGKTALAWWLATSAAQYDAEIRVVYASVEMAPHYLLNRLAARLSGLRLAALFSGRAAHEPEFTKQFAFAVSEMEKFIDRITFIESPVAVESIIEAVEATGARLVVVDYLQRLRLDPAGSRREAVEDALGRLTDMARRTGAAVLMLSSVSRTADSGTTRYANSRDLGAFRETGAIEFDADAAYLLEPATKMTDDMLACPDIELRLRCLKNRHALPKHVTLRFDRYRQGFEAVVVEAQGCG